MKLMTYLLLITPMISMLVMISQQSHFLMVLLSLESITLSLIIMSSMSMLLLNSSTPVLSVVILTFSACEAALGLSLMVIMSRSRGTDMLKSMSLNKC